MDRCHLCKAWPKVLIDTISSVPSIHRLKSKLLFSALAIFKLFTVVLVEVGCFLSSWQKTAKIRQIFKTVDLINGSILSIECLRMDRWLLVR
jgi:hypothetical protein